MNYQKCKELFFDYLSEFVEYQNFTQQEIQNQILEFQLSNDLTYIRPEFCHNDGGRIPNDQNVISKARALGLQMAKEIGKQFFTGKLNLTTVTMPIYINICKTSLEVLLLHTCYFPLYMGIIQNETDPLIRFKFVICAIVASQHPLHCFKKPLNPILGETFQGYYNDGTQLFAEQISHHPPISFYQVYGKNYKYTGFYDSEARASFNGLQVIQQLKKITNKGKRQFLFNDGQLIQCSFAQDKFSGMFMGTPCQELVDSFIFADKKNKLQCQIKFGCVKKMPSDYFISEILQNGKIISELKGSYLSFLDIDNKRYFDYRQYQPYQIQYSKKTLESDSQKRKDLILMKLGFINQLQGNIEEAKKYKLDLEQQQRDDRKYRNLK